MSDTGTPAPAAPEPLDRRAVLLEQFNEIENAPKGPDDPGAADRVTEAETKDRSSPHFGKPAGKPRDEAGRFAPKPDAAAVDASQPLQQADQPEPWRQAPKSWKKELATGWGKLDPAYQQYVHEREQQMHAGIEPLLPKAELADKVMQAAAPYMQTIQGLGLDLPRAVAGLMEVDHNLRTLPYQQRLQLLAQTALSYGIDITGQAQALQQQGIDPYMQRFQQTQQELVNVKGQVQSLLDQQKTIQQETALEQIQRFAKSAEHFEEVKPLMADLLQGRLAVDIEDAYEKAIRLTPEIFDKVQAAKQAALETEKKAAANSAAQRAKAAAVSVRSATPGATAPSDARDRRSVLREQFDALSERL